MAYRQQQRSSSRFNSNEVMRTMTLREHATMYRDFFFGDNNRVPDVPLPQQQCNPSELVPDGSNGLKVCWLGHSSLLIMMGGYLILTDPVFGRKVSPVGPKKFNQEPPLDPRKLPVIDVVVISHDHYDHLNKASILQLKDKARFFLVPLKVGERLVRWGIDEQRICELDWWQEFRKMSGLTIAATPVQHFSGRGMFDRNTTQCSSWVIRSDKHSLYFSGDTGYSDAFRSIGQTYGPFELCFLECGAYNRRWSKIHMFPEETVQAFIDLTGSILHPIHWGTYNLSLHPWYEPMERLNASAQNHGVRISTPVIGQVIDYRRRVAPNPWWRPAMERTLLLRPRREQVADQSVSLGSDTGSEPISR